jgi:hypothetical protein
VGAHVGEGREGEGGGDGTSKKVSEASQLCCVTNSRSMIDYNHLS